MTTQSETIPTEKLFINDVMITVYDAVKLAKKAGELNQALAQRKIDRSSIRAELEVQERLVSDQITKVTMTVLKYKFPLSE